MRTIALMLYATVVTGVGQESEDNEFSKVVFREDGSFRQVWGDGRVAKLVEETFELRPISIELEYAKNSCASVPPPSCTLRNETQLRKLMYVWEKNPVDPTKVGQVLVGDRYEDGDVNYYIETFLNTQYAQTMARELGLRSFGRPMKDALVCDRFDWLPETDGGRLMVPAWFSQFEMPVHEFCGQGTVCRSLNRYTSGAKSVLLNKSGASEYQVDDVGLFNAEITAYATMALGYTTEFVFDVAQYRNHPNRIAPDDRYPSPICKVEFNLDFGQFFEQYQYIEQEEDNPVYDPQKVEEVLNDPLDFQQYVFPWQLYWDGGITAE